MQVISMCYVLIAKMVEREGPTEYKDVTLDELLIGLPRDKGITYYID